jgi:hypothetical protein
MEITGFIKRLEDIFNAYGDPAPVQKLVMEENQFSELLRISHRLPYMNFSDPNLSDGLKDAISEELKVIAAEQTPLHSFLKEAKRQYDENGFCIIRLPEVVAGCEREDIQRILVPLMSEFGVPFGAFKNKGLYQTLGVNSEAKTLRAESTGYIPTHLDLDQMEKPPHGLGLFCVRPDPYGGGENTLFNYARFLDLLSEEEKDLLRSIKYSYSHAFDTNGVGEELNPHPLLDDQGIFRFNGKATPDLAGDLAKLFNKLDGYFLEHSTKVLLQTGDLLLINQEKALHGRLALNNPYNRAEASQDRFLIEAYLRHEP